MTKEKYDNRNDIDKRQTIAHSVVFTQMNSKKGIKIFGERPVNTMLKDFRQMNEGPMLDKHVFGP